MVTGRSLRLQHFLLLRHGVLECAAAGDALSHRAADARAFEFRARGAKNGLRRAKLRDQLSGAARSEARNQPQRKPV